jgi:RNA polymerase sigma-70 factor, ECF subfamily
MTSTEPSDQPNSSSQGFAQVAEPLRREIKAHCYRMMGSLQEAEDLVQESYLRAWRSFDSFEGGSFRAWLYKIATNACLNALESRKLARRLLPDQRFPATAQMPNGMPASDIVWLEPYPEFDLENIADDAPNPEARYSSREAIQLAFVAAIQELPPRQRAALMLCDVLGWAAAEAAELLGGTTASINSALQRARETLSKRYPDGRPQTMTKPNPAQQKMLGQYVKAWETRDIDGFVSLLKEDATYTMPPLPQWYAGREAIRTFFVFAFGLYEGFRMMPTEANSQPAFAAYSRKAADSAWTAHSLQVLSLDLNGEISALTLFVKPEVERVFEKFKLLLVLPN